MERFASSADTSIVRMFSLLFLTSSCSAAGVMSAEGHP
ncbi:hypothetical protein AYI68_g6739, partial [Smittium mucronatum]